MENIENNNEEVELNEQEFNKLMQVRLDKLKELQEAGQDPYEITEYDRTNTAGEIKAKFDNFENKDVSIAGRIIAKRIMGKASFCTLQDSDDRIQSYVSINDIGEEAYKAFKTWDIGDVIGLKGFVFKTKTEEISVHAKEVVLLSKSLRPLPEKFHGLKDVDLRYRQRYLDLIMNPEVKETFKIRTAIIKEIRSILDEKGYLEVETPILNTISGGATARPFITHHNTLDLDMYLRIATELNLKRLIVGGFDKVYEIGRIFRNEGMDIRHNPEFTSIEFYSAYENYHDMMNLTEEMFSRIAMKVKGTYKFSYQGQELDFTPGGWKKITMIDSVKEACGVDFNTIKTDAEAVKIAKEHNIEIPVGKETRGNIIALFFDEYVEKTLIQPTFIYDYPIEVSPLAKKCKEDPRLTQRFEFFICGREYGNAFSELNDPIDQYERFKKEVEAKANGDDEAGMMDDDFINALQYGMPPTGGEGIGIDRMVMLFTDAPSIRDVLFFPTMKPVSGSTNVTSSEGKLDIKPVTLGQTDLKEVDTKTELVEVKYDYSKGISREKALEILKKYNKEEFHIRHALTVEGVMKYFARQLGENEEYWGNIGLLHDVDFEQYPEEHCKKCIELLQSENVDNAIINSICSHGYGICSDIKPNHIMEKILFATDELTGLIWACAKMRPSKSTKDMEVSSLKKKFKDKKFAAGCSRDIISQGAEMLGWELDELFEKTILAMRECEDEVNNAMN